VTTEDAIAGCLLGQAVGDALGLPMEGLSRRRAARLFPEPDRMRFLFGRGFGSDDTEHAAMTANALLRSGGDVGRFHRSLAWRLRWWFLSGPPGVGRATAKACLKLWLLPWAASGVRSAGNGPAMRAVVLGAAVADRERMFELVDASTRLTHTDPAAVIGARAVALAARPGADLRGVADQLARLDPEPRGAAAVLRDLLGRAVEAFETGRGVDEFVRSVGLERGVSGFIAHTGPVALFAAFRHADDYRAAVQRVIRCGGDTDTVAAITGAIVGSRVGRAGIPPEWVGRFADWPRSADYLDRLARRLATTDWRSAPQPAEPLAWWAVPARNLVFLAAVLAHAGRRALPPY
jgi:ADP-ribosylglycohydrolase